MIAVGVCALLLAPLGWAVRQTERQRQAALRAVREADRARRLGQRARAEALRAASLARVAAARSRDDEEEIDGTARPGRSPAGTGAEGGLWAALTVTPAASRRGETREPSLEFTLVNDGAEVLDPEIALSQLVVDGAVWPDSGLVLGNGPRDARFAALPPGDSLRFTRALGGSFPEPGVYRVRWQGARFRSAEVVFRVLPGRSP
jgi:hypothetical protein